MDAVQVGRSYVVGWGTLALINTGLAQSKGRGRMAWFLASILLGPIATFIIVVTDDPEPKLPSDQPGAVGSSQDAHSRHEAGR